MPVSDAMRVDLLAKAKQASSGGQQNTAIHSRLLPVIALRLALRADLAAGAKATAQAATPGQGASDPEHG